MIDKIKLKKGADHFLSGPRPFLSDIYRRILCLSVGHYITIPMMWTTAAATHARTHCHTTMPAAHLPPSSRFTDAMAATHGV